MEIRDYLRQIRRYLWLVIAIPVIAALVTGGFMELRPSVYQADASVVVPAITASGFSQSAASQYVDTFKDVIVSQPVLNDVFQKYNIPVDELASGLSASTVTPSSNIINVVLLGKDKQNLIGAVHEATVDTLNAIAAPRLAQAKLAVADANTLVEQANANYDTWVTATGDVSPQLQFNGYLTQLNLQTANYQVAKAHGDAKAMAAASALITYYQAKVNTYGAYLQQYAGLQQAQAAARAASDHAASELIDAQALVTTDAAPGTVSTHSVGRLSKLADTIKFAGIAFAIALLMLLGLLLILELMRPARRAATGTAGQGTLAFGPQQPQSKTVPTSAPAAAPEPEPVTAAAESFAAPPAPPSEARDPWRASPAATSAVGGNGNGNGHANGKSNGNGHANGNGNGHAGAPEVEADPQRTGPGMATRR